MSDARFEAFPRRDGHLHVEGVPVSEIAAQVGTPVYLYSAGALDMATRAFDPLPLIRVSFRVIRCSERDHCNHRQ